MNTIPDVARAEFFIDWDKYSIRPVEEGDFKHDFSSGVVFPDATDASVTFGLKPVPAALEHADIYDFDSPNSFAYVALKNPGNNAGAPTPVAYALCGLNTIYQSHQFYISVDKALKSTRVPFELLNMLANHASKQGTKTLFCHADESNIAMRALAEKMHMSVRLESGQAHGVMYSMSIDEHPSIVNF